MTTRSNVFPQTPGFMAVATVAFDSATTAIPLAQQLFHNLAENGISYCHWKSNATLPVALRGKTDLDLLVARQDAARFTELLMQMGFKAAEASGEARLPGIHHYYGYDDEHGSLLHVHAHFQLIVGDDMAKNYHLPMERALLTSACEEHGVKISAPEYEYVLLVLRLVLKHCALDSILCFCGRIRPCERAELKYLEARIDRTCVGDIVERELPWVGVRFFDTCIAALQPQAGFWTRIAVAHRLHNCLRVWGRQSESRNTGVKIGHRVHRAICRLLEHKHKKQLASGGAILALVGGDGAGKTTIVRGLAAWLSRDFATAVFHLGKPPWSLTTYAVRAAIKLLRCSAEALAWSLPWRSGSSNRADPVPGYFELLRDLCTARDRFNSYLRARRYANNGGLSICDRFPLPQIRLMEASHFRCGPAIAAPNRLARWMLQAEMKYHEAILAPELLFVLKVDPIRAAARKPEEKPSFVMARCQEIWDCDWTATPAHVVDASHPIDQVLSTIKSIVWRSL